MSAYDDILAGGLAVQISMHGQAVGYRSDFYGLSGTINAIVGAENLAVVESEDGSRTRRRQRTLQVETGELDDGKVPEPREGDVFMIGLDAWTAVEIPRTGHGFAEIVVTRPERTNAAGRKLPGRN